MPTVAESALPGFNSISWIGLLAPAGTPQPVIEKVTADVRAILETPEVRDRLIAQGATPVASSPAEFKALIETDRARYAKIIIEKGITADQ